jgi:dTDP-4-amino-4,6-dideoxygalactose transaminase
MDEIRAALATSLMDRLPARLAAHRRNHDRVAAGLSTIRGIVPRRPVTPDGYLGEAVLFRIPGAAATLVAWFARALRAEGIDARALGDPEDTNIRSFWNWRFLLGPDAAAARSRWPRTAAYLTESIDIPLSANLDANDCDQVVAAVDRIVSALATR